MIRVYPNTVQIPSFILKYVDFDYRILQSGGICIVIKASYLAAVVCALHRVQQLHGGWVSDERHVGVGRDARVGVAQLVRVLVGGVVCPQVLRNAERQSS